MAELEDRECKVLNRVVAALREVVDREGACRGQGVALRVSQLTGLSESVVRKNLRTLQALKVITMGVVLEPHRFFNATPRRVFQVRLLKPHATIVNRNGFFEVAE